MGDRPRRTGRRLTVELPFDPSLAEHSDLADTITQSPTLVSDEAALRAAGVDYADSTVCYSTPVPSR